MASSSGTSAVVSAGDNYSDDTVTGFDAEVQVGEDASAKDDVENRWSMRRSLSAGPPTGESSARIEASPAPSDASSGSYMSSAFYESQSESLELSPLGSTATLRPDSDGKPRAAKTGSSTHFSRSDKGNGRASNQSMLPPSNLAGLPFLPLLEICCYLDLLSIKSLYHTHRQLRRTIDDSSSSFFRPVYERWGVVERATGMIMFRHENEGRSSGETAEETEARKQKWKREMKQAKEGLHTEFISCLKSAYWLTEAPWDTNNLTLIESRFLSELVSSSHGRPTLSASFRTYAKFGYQLTGWHHLAILINRFCFLCAFRPKDTSEGPVIKILRGHEKECEGCGTSSCGHHENEPEAVRALEVETEIEAEERSTNPFGLLPPHTNNDPNADGGGAGGLLHWQLPNGGVAAGGAGNPAHLIPPFMNNLLNNNTNGLGAPPGPFNNPNTENDDEFDDNENDIWAPGPPHVENAGMHNLQDLMLPEYVSEGDEGDDGDHSQHTGLEHQAGHLLGGNVHNHYLQPEQQPHHHTQDGQENFSVSHGTQYSQPLDDESIYSDDGDNEWQFGTAGYPTAHSSQQQPQPQLQASASTTTQNSSAAVSVPAAAHSSTLSVEEETLGASPALPSQPAPLAQNLSLVVPPPQLHQQAPTPAPGVTIAHAAAPTHTHYIPPPQMSIARGGHTSQSLRREASSTRRSQYGGTFRPGGPSDYQPFGRTALVRGPMMQLNDDLQIHARRAFGYENVCADCWRKEKVRRKFERRS